MGEVFPGKVKMPPQRTFLQHPPGLSPSVNRQSLPIHKFIFDDAHSCTKYLCGKVIGRAGLSLTTILGAGKGPHQKYTKQRRRENPQNISILNVSVLDA
jgi:hypothetical protein